LLIKTFQQRQFYIKRHTANTVTQTRKKRPEFPSTKFDPVFMTSQFRNDHYDLYIILRLGTGHNLAGGVGRWKQWEGHIFFSQEKGGFIKY
jgi:hypothetical protein